MPLLELTKVRAAYADKVEVLHGIDLSVHSGEFVTLIGANGAGKTTIMKTIMGQLPYRQGAIRFEDTPISQWRTTDIARLGISLVPEGRGIFLGLSVYDNLRVAATRWLKFGAPIERQIDHAFALFPVLAERRRQAAWSLSGGQQQMLAIGRAMMSRPRLLLLDEPSLGLAPNLVDHVFDALKRINDDGVTILLVEQNAYLALEFSGRGYVIERGSIALTGSSANLLSDERVRQAYLGA
jgi:branched-chain amino acid transport system ATP-binding protein